MAARLDVPGRLAEGRGALAHLQTLVAAAARRGWQHPQLTGADRRLTECYDGLAGLDPRRLDADAAALHTAAGAAERARQLQQDAATRLGDDWAGAGGWAAAALLAEHDRSATVVCAGLARAGRAVAELRDRLWAAVDAAVAATVDADAAAGANRPRWLAAADAVLAGVADPEPGRIVDAEVVPFVAEAVAGGWLVALQAARAAVDAGYDDAIRAALPDPGVVFTVPAADPPVSPGVLSPVPPIVPGPNGPAPDGSPGGAVGFTDLGVAAPRGAPTPDRLAPDPADVDPFADPFDAGLPDADPLDPLAGVGGLPGVLPGLGALAGLLPQLLGLLFGSGDPGLGSGLFGDPLRADPFGGLGDGAELTAHRGEPSRDGEPGAPDETDDPEDPDDVDETQAPAEEAGGPDSEHPGAQLDTAAPVSGGTESAADSAAPEPDASGVPQPAAPPAGSTDAAAGPDPAATGSPKPAPVPQAADAAEPKTPCEIAADALPQVGE